MGNIFFPYQGGQVEHANAKDRLFYLYMDTNRLSSSLGLKNDWATSLLLVLLLLSSGMSWSPSASLQLLYSFFEGQVVFHHVKLDDSTTFCITGMAFEKAFP